MNAMNTAVMLARTTSTRVTSTSGNCFENTATAALQPVNINTHSSSEPSCEPHVAEIRYCIGNSELELVATFNTLKSPCANAVIKQANAMVTRPNSASVLLRVKSAIATPRRKLATPATQALLIATKNARIREKRPSSGIMMTRNPGYSKTAILGGCAVRSCGSGAPQALLH